MNLGTKGAGHGGAVREKTTRTKSVIDFAFDFDDLGDYEKNDSNTVTYQDDYATFNALPSDFEVPW